MNTTSIIEIQKKGIFMHRLVYVVFCLQRIVLQLTCDALELKNTVIILSFLLICEIIEEFFHYTDFYGKIQAVRIVRYIQCVLTTIMLLFLQGSENSEFMIFALFLMFIVDFFISMKPDNKVSAVVFILLICFPAITVILTKITFDPDEHWMFLFFDVLMFLLVLSGETYIFLDFMIQLNQTIMDQHHEFEEVVEKNENILNMQEKLKKTNDQLNIQKLGLQMANKQIKEANDEMVVQTEILRYIAMSFDVAKISNEITDAIMRVKGLGFCAVYIKEGVYLNKYPNYVIKTDIGQLQSKIKDHMEEIYKKMIADNQNEAIYHEDLKVEFPFLQDVDIHSIYIKVLELDGKTYGLFMLGDRKDDLFVENMSFYHAVIAQYDIAIGNARIYNEMQNMARKDGLTGINNRIYFSELFKNTVSKVKESDSCMCVALFDIDKFKSVNDTYGHLAGDEVIKRIASVTEACIEKYNGFVCRYGGEEFVAVLPDRKLEVAQPIIEELFEELCRQVVVYNEWEIHLSVSIGLTAYPEICKSTDDLLKRADWCMYYAKEHGRCQIYVDDGSIERD